MIISISSPRKGNGQTVLSIMLSALISNTLKQDVCLVDTNKYCADVDFYLSNALVTKGLDDFCLMHDLRTLNDISFKESCTKKIIKHLYALASSSNFSLDQAKSDIFFEYLRKSFEFIVVDCLGGTSVTSAMFLDKSDVIVLTIDQSRASIYMLEENRSFYLNRKEKIILVVNKYLDNIGSMEATYKFPQIKKDLRKIGFDVPILQVPFSIQLLNESNESSLLNFIVHNVDPEYIEALKRVCNQLTEGVFLSSEPQKKYSFLNTINRFLAGEW